jgi:hypothetical protein
MLAAADLSRCPQPQILASLCGVAYGSDVARKRNKQLPTGRYDLLEIAARVEKRRKQRKVAAKALYGDLHLAKWDWSKKVRNKGSSFTVAELGLIADLLDAPPGWPFLPEEFWTHPANGSPSSGS